jgi:hypothetical protein
MLENVPTILDPITYLNAGKSSYKIIEICKLFSCIYENLNNFKMSIEGNLIKHDENVICLLLDIMK